MTRLPPLTAGLDGAKGELGEIGSPEVHGATGALLWGQGTVGVGFPLESAKEGGAGRSGQFDRIAGGMEGMGADAPP